MHSGSMWTSFHVDPTRDPSHFGSSPTSSSGSEANPYRVDALVAATNVEAVRRALNCTDMRPPITPVVLAVFLVPTAISAQAIGSLPKTTKLPSSVRAMALGDSYVMNSGQADALFYHPAQLTSARGFGADLQRWGAASSAAAFSGAFDFFGGTWGVGLRVLQYGVPDGSTLQAPIGQDHQFVAGGDPASERTATIGYARDIFGISAGVSVDLLDARIESSQHNVALFDIGISKDVGPLGVGLTAQDIGEKPLVNSGSEPARIVLGAGAYGQQVGIFDLGLAAHLGRDADDEWAYGGGVELGYYPIQGRTFIARLGFQDTPEGSDASPLTTGFAFWADDVRIEWAFRPFSGGDQGGTHRIGVSWR